MNEGSQLASAMLAVAFAGVMLVAGQLYIQSRPERLTAIPTSKNIHEARIIIRIRLVELAPKGDSGCSTDRPSLGLYELILFDGR